MDASDRRLVILYQSVVLQEEQTWTLNILRVQQGQYASFTHCLYLQELFYGFAWEDLFLLILDDRAYVADHADATLLVVAQIFRAQPSCSQGDRDCRRFESSREPNR